MLNSGKGWCGLLTGGEEPHIGGLVMAVPRPSLTGEGMSCDVWINPVPGHKDTEVAVPLAKALCLHFNAVVTISAGIHVDAATVEDIRLISDNCRAAGEIFLSQAGYPETSD